MYSKEKVIHKVLTYLLTGLLFLCGWVLIKGWINGSFRSLESLRQYIASYGKWGPVVLTVIQGLQVVLPVLPGFLGCVVGGSMFGAVVGFWINYIGICTGSIAAYYLARHYGVRLVQLMLPLEKYERYAQWIRRQKSYTWIFFLSILLPLVPDDFLCYFSGLIRMKAKQFIWIILIAKPWCILFYCLFFSYYL